MQIHICTIEDRHNHSHIPPTRQCYPRRTAAVRLEFTITSESGQAQTSLIQILIANATWKGSANGHASTTRSSIEIIVHNIQSIEETTKTTRLRTVLVTILPTIENP